MWIRVDINIFVGMHMLGRNFKTGLGRVTGIHYSWESTNTSQDFFQIAWVINRIWAKKSVEDVLLFEDMNLEKTVLDVIWEDLVMIHHNWNWEIKVEVFAEDSTTGGTDNIRMQKVDTVEGLLTSGSCPRVLSSDITLTRRISVSPPLLISKLSRMTSSLFWWDIICRWCRGHDSIVRSLFTISSTCILTLSVPSVALAFTTSQMNPPTLSNVLKYDPVLFTPKSCPRALQFLSLRTSSTNFTAFTRFVIQVIWNKSCDVFVDSHEQCIFSDFFKISLDDSSDHVLSKKEMTMSSRIQIRDDSIRVHYDLRLYIVSIILSPINS